MLNRKYKYEKVRIGTEVTATSFSLKTDMFAIRLNCSNKFLGTKVIIVYLEVITWFVE